jgi:Listeria-Bacteroides repeat domain (List_Bact_rpt).
MVKASKATAKILLVILMVCLMAVTLTACKSGGKGVNTDGMILVVYDGTPGFLRNKTDHVRKLFVNVNSKLPKYLDYYPQNDSYTDPSLGLASFSGYSLLGWYLDSADAGTYAEDDAGEYVLLSGENGVYSLSATGDLVYTYVENEDGEFVYLSAEEPQSLATEDEEDDFSAVKYVFVNGAFKIYDTDNADHQAAFSAHGEFTYDTVTAFVGENYAKYVVYEEITSADMKALYVEEQRYAMGYVAYEEKYEGLDRFTLVEGYVDINFLLEADEEGEYVFIDEKYELYDETNLDHVDAASTRATINNSYKFTPTTEISSPSYLTRYSASFRYWEFETERVTKELYAAYCAEKGYSEEDGFLTLKAHWSAKPTVQFIYPDGRITAITTKKSSDNTKDLPLVKGETIGSLQGIPTQAGSTFVGWSKSATEYQPWDFANDVFPINAGIVKLYAFMVEGTYTRITTANDLKKVGENPSGSYLLCKDIDLSKSTEMTGAGYYHLTTSNPLGLKANDEFSGKFLSMGCKISNFNLYVENFQKAIEVDSGKGVEKSYGLFPKVSGATISGLTVENCKVIISNDSGSLSIRIYNSNVGVLIGSANGAATTVTDCKLVNVKIEPLSQNGGNMKHNLSVGGYVAAGADNVDLPAAGEGANFSDCIFDDNMTKMKNGSTYAATYTTHF